MAEAPLAFRPPSLAAYRPVDSRMITLDPFVPGQPFELEADPRFHALRASLRQRLLGLRLPAFAVAALLALAFLLHSFASVALLAYVGGWLIQGAVVWLVIKAMMAEWVWKRIREARFLFATLSPPSGEPPERILQQRRLRREALRFGIAAGFAALGGVLAYRFKTGTAPDELTFLFITVPLIFFSLMGVGFSGFALLRTFSAPRASYLDRFDFLRMELVRSCYEKPLQGWLLRRVLSVVGVFPVIVVTGFFNRCFGIC
jgi:hypothetical protein